MLSGCQVVTRKATPPLVTTVVNMQHGDDEEFTIPARENCTHHCWVVVCNHTSLVPIRVRAAHPTEFSVNFPHRCFVNCVSLQNAHNFHHLIPRTVHTNKWFKKRYTREQMREGINVCTSCHHAIHALIPDEKELGSAITRGRSCWPIPRLRTMLRGSGEGEQVLPTPLR